MPNLKDSLELFWNKVSDVMKFKVSPISTVEPPWWFYSNELTKGSMFSFICTEAFNGSKTLYSHQLSK